MRRRRRLALILLGTLGALVALEVTLQVVAFALWRSAQAGDRGGVDTVLCVGDSFTYGLGATAAAGSYPRQLEAALRALGQERTVVNGGWPGQTSREILLKLPEQLARHRPKVVCILAGMNDPWSRPARVRAEELHAEAAPFPVQFRLLRLGRLMADWFRPREEGDRPFVGVWHQGDDELVFEANGRLRLGKDELRWFEDDQLGLQVVMPDGEVVAMRCHVADGRLTIGGRRFEGTFDRGPAPPPSAVVLGERALAAQDLAAARGHFLAALADPASSARAREGLVRVAVAQGDDAERDASLVALRGEFGRVADPATGACLVQALAVAGDVGGALATAKVVLDKAPDNLRTWEVLLTHGLAKSRAEVLARMDEVLAAAPAGVAWRPTLLQMRANVRLSSDPDGALDDFFAAFLQDGNGPFLVRQLELAAAALPPARVESALGRLAAGAAARVRASLAASGEEGVFAILRAHLEHAVSLCKAAGADVVLVSYPEPEPMRDRIVSAVAAGTGVRHVDPHAAFAAALRQRERAQVFTHDGHCTDVGYGILAQQVAEALR